MTIGNYDFKGPFLLEEFSYLDKACVYAILCENINGEFNILYIGQSGEIMTRIDNHNKKYCWENNCLYGNLYIAIFETPSSRYTKDDRLAIESELINLYEPICNKI